MVNIISHPAREFHQSFNNIKLFVLVILILKHDGYTNTCVYEYVNIVYHLQSTPIYSSFTRNYKSINIFNFTMPFTLQLGFNVYR